MGSYLLDLVSQHRTVPSSDPERKKQTVDTFTEQTLQVSDFMRVMLNNFITMYIWKETTFGPSKIP